jgi:hypothetical protein
LGWQTLDIKKLYRSVLNLFTELDQAQWYLLQLCKMGGVGLPPFESIGCVGLFPFISLCWVGLLPFVSLVGWIISICIYWWDWDFSVISSATSWLPDWFVRDNSVQISRYEKKNDRLGYLVMNFNPLGG